MGADFGEKTEEEFKADVETFQKKLETLKKETTETEEKLAALRKEYTEMMLKEHPKLYQVYTIQKTIRGNEVRVDFNCPYRTEEIATKVALGRVKISPDGVVRWGIDIIPSTAEKFHI